MTRFLAAFLLVLAPAAALADGPASRPAKSFAIEGEELKGELPKPDLTQLSPRTFAEHGSLIQVRADFVPEIIQSARNL
jgi:hypothetical protein